MKVNGRRRPVEMCKKYWTAVLIILILAVSSNLFSQEISEKQDLAVFKLSYYDYDIPRGALGSIDEEIKAVFINIGRFRVIGMSYRLSLDDVREFIEKIKELKQEKVEIPEEYKMGHEVFTENDLNRLIGTFYVVIPAVTFYDVVKDQKGNYNAEVKVSFTIVNVEEGTTFAQFFVDTSGTSDLSGDRAAQRAISQIPLYLEYEIAKIPEFTIKSAVLERRGGEVVIELGRNMGILLGQEFAVLSSRILETGRVFKSETGLITIKEVGEEVSLGTVIYGSPEEGDQVKEIPRLGFELTPYFNVLLNPFLAEDETKIFYVAGVRVSVTKRFYNFRPFAGIEFPLPFPLGDEDTLLPWLWVAGFPMSFYIGGEVTFYMGRLRLAPQAAFGASFLIPWIEAVEDPVFTHIGGFINANISYLFTRDMYFTIDVGYKHWICIWDPLLDYITDATASYGGFMIGGGVSIKM
jgi:hypothetical protein